MSRYDTVKCDRCGDQRSLEGGGTEEIRANWGRLYAATLQGADKVGTSQIPADLCGNCLDELVEWFDGRELAKPGK